MNGDWISILLFWYFYLFFVGFIREKINMKMIDKFLFLKVGIGSSVFRLVLVGGEV